jgi:hypothetical protein
VLNLKDECTHNREHRVHSISHRADEIDTPHLRTGMPSDKFSFPVPLRVVLTHVLSPLGPVLLLLVSRCPLVALVLAPPAPVLLLLVSRCPLVALVLAPPAPLLLLLAVWCWLVVLVLAVVLAPPAPLLLLLALNPAICDTPHQTHCVGNSIFPHFVMVMTVLWAELWFVVECRALCKKKHLVGILPLSI